MQLGERERKDIDRDVLQLGQFAIEASAIRTVGVREHIKLSRTVSEADCILQVELSNIDLGAVRLLERLRQILLRPQIDDVPGNQDREVVTHKKDFTALHDRPEARDRRLDLGTLSGWETLDQLLREVGVSECRVPRDNESGGEFGNASHGSGCSGWCRKWRSKVLAVRLLRR